MTIRFGLSAAMGGALALSAFTLPAMAVPQADRPSNASVQAEAPIGKVAMTVEAEDDGANCTKSRKRMFVDGEGWIVRRVTTCR